MFASPNMTFLNTTTQSYKESPFANIVLPVFKFLHWINMFPGSFQLDSEGSIRFVKASVFRKVLSLSLQAITTCHLVGTCALYQLSMSSFMKLMFQIVTFAYISYNLVWYLTLNFKGEKLENIFRMIRRLEIEFVQIGCVLPKPFTKTVMSWCLVVTYLIIALSYTLIMRLNIALLLNGAPAFVEPVANMLIIELNSVFHLGITYNSSVSTFENNLLLSIPMIIISIYYDLTWTFGFLMNFLWGATFILIFKSFFDVIGKISSRNTLKDIRRYNRITFVIDAYNEVFTLNMMCAVFAGSLHFSVYLSTMFLSQDTGLRAVMTGASFGIFWLQIFCAAEVCNCAQKMATILKNRYQNESTWKGKHATCTETLQGIVIVFNEMLAGNVGFQGWGFFTVTYSFIGSVLSLIATYAIVTMQMYGSPVQA
ncbi:unnamed protein product [Allacma fusca]|uniref:Gustatory receptor n=1 Tax=Allacma fusca TaxID=39272 RepID=A0A8J2LKK0_9HEXA|nr:unnamed protein product [Allacma fusca]